MSAVSWPEYHIGIRAQHNTLFIGKKKEGEEDWSSASGNRTDEIMMKVMDKFNRDIKKNGDPNKPYAGYVVPGLGKLVFIKEGFDFSVKPSPRKKSKE